MTAPAPSSPPRTISAEHGGAKAAARAEHLPADLIAQSLIILHGGGQRGLCVQAVSATYNMHVELYGRWVVWVLSAW
eukprot:scaffold118019_cov19-Tisochrysis_lutea.AAC.4